MSKATKIGGIVALAIGNVLLIINIINIIILETITGPGSYGHTQSLLYLLIAVLAIGGGAVGIVGKRSGGITVLIAGLLVLIFGIFCQIDILTFGILMPPIALNIVFSPLQAQAVACVRITIRE